MKLLEIIDAKNIEVKRKLQREPYYNRRTTKSIGTGNSFGVDADANDPHLIKKKSLKTKNKSDGFDEYAKAIINSGMNGSNPFLPRIYKRSEFTMAKNEKQKAYTYSIEKLEPITECSFREIVMLAETAGIREDVLEIHVNEYKECKGAANEDQCKYDVRDNIIYEISSFLDGLILKDKISPNEQLNKAVDVVKAALHVSGRFELDFTSSNIMIRRTSVGPQLVLSDPIFDHEYTDEY